MIAGRGLADIPGLSEEEFLREVRKGEKEEEDEEEVEEVEEEVGFEATQDENQGPVPE